MSDLITLMGIQLRCLNDLVEWEYNTETKDSFDMLVESNSSLKACFTFAGLNGDVEQFEPTLVRKMSIGVVSYIPLRFSSTGDLITNEGELVSELFAYHMTGLTAKCKASFFVDPWGKIQSPDLILDISFCDTWFHDLIVNEELNRRVVSHGLTGDHFTSKLQRLKESLAKRNACRGEYVHFDEVFPKDGPDVR